MSGRIDKFLRHEFNPEFDELQIAWIEDKVVNGLTKTYYSLANMMDTGKIDIKAVEASYNEIMSLISKIRGLRHE